MTPIDGVSRALELLRRRLGGAAGARSRASAASAGAAAPEAADTAAARGPGAMRQAIALRLQALDPDEASYPQRATEAFVEAVLLGEFGQALTNEPQFRQVILGVAREMRAEPATAGELDTLLQSLRKG